MNSLKMKRSSLSVLSEDLFSQLFLKKVKKGKNSANDNYYGEIDLLVTGFTRLILAGRKVIKVAINKINFCDN